MNVELSWGEVFHGCLVGVSRRIRRLRSGSKHRWGYDSHSWTAELESACAELAVAKALDRYWSDVPVPDHDGDVGDGLQVRHTLRQDGRLIVHREDEDGHDFVLVRGEAPRFDVAGFLPGVEAKREVYWTDPGTAGRPAFFVPAEKLRPVQELAGLAERAAA